MTVQTPLQWEEELLSIAKACQGRPSAKIAAVIKKAAADLNGLQIEVSRCEEIILQQQRKIEYLQKRQRPDEM
jgi:hypothetical protein